MRNVEWVEEIGVFYRGAGNVQGNCVLVIMAGLVGAEENRDPPSIEYGGNRESSTWVETPIGKVAVDKGVEWQGIKVYLSLTFDLVAVDVKTGKTLWSQMVGAFWTRVGFKLVEVGPGKKTWAVELKRRPRQCRS